MDVFFSGIFAGVPDYLAQGGAVLVPLIAVSVWMWYLIVSKLREISWWKRGENAAGIRDLRRIFEQERAFDTDADRKLLTVLVRRQQDAVDRHIQTIFVLAAVAPLLGLLGTVAGMITTFEAISRFGTANARALASGISEALITTQAGLVVAVPGLFMGHMLQRQAEAVKNRMSRFLLSAGRELESLCSEEPEKEECR